MNYGGLDLKPGVYAIVESAAYYDAGPALQTSEMFAPSGRKFVPAMVYLADVEALWHL
jgi:hypothetical protein